MKDNVDNTQQLIFLQSLLTGVKKGTTQQQQTLKVSVKDKVKKSNLQIEVYPNATKSLPYRFIENGSTGLWWDWDTPEKISSTFKLRNLL